MSWIGEHCLALDDTMSVSTGSTADRFRLRTALVTNLVE